jgi:putative nucleotidyltransferase with HDIG domain
MRVKVLTATTLIAVAPAAAVWELQARGIVGGFVPCAAIGAALSLIMYSIGARAWERSDRTGDVLFGDLMIWGWISRSYQLRRIADAASLLGVQRVDRADATDPLRLSIARRTQLLAQLATDLEARDPYTHGHSRRVARYATLIAQRMGINGEELARIRTAAALHDVGKLETPIEILHKPGRLTDAEFAIVQEHTVTGAVMVAILEDPELSAIVRHHHERLDGTGYPDRLAGEEIPLGARIIAVADTFDAITSERPYRAARPHREALRILRAEAGTQLDGDAVHAFLAVYKGRGPLSAWVGAADLGERLVALLIPGALGSTARVAAIAAGAAALGSGASALTAAGSSAATVASAPRVAYTTIASRAVHRGVHTFTSGTRAALGRAKTTHRAVGAPGAVMQSIFTGGQSPQRIGVHSLAGAPTATPGTPAASTPGGPGTTGTTTTSGGTNSPSPTVQATVTAPAPLPPASVGVSAGSSSPGSVSVGATANTGVGPSVSATATAGSSGAGVQATLPGVGTVKLGIGGGG